MQSFLLIYQAANWIESGVILACVIAPLFFLKNRVSRWLWLMPVCAGVSLITRIAWNLLVLLVPFVMQNLNASGAGFSGIEILITVISFLGCLGQLAFGGAIVALLLTIRDVARQLDSLDEQIERARLSRSAQPAAN